MLSKVSEVPPTKGLTCDVVLENGDKLYSVKYKVNDDGAEVWYKSNGTFYPVSPNDMWELGEF